MNYSIPNFANNARQPVPVVHLEGVSKSYDLGDVSVAALTNINLSIYPGEFVALTGPSGSGKSTLMSLIGCLDQPDHGHMVLAGAPLGGLSERAIVTLRNRKLGFIFQSFNLIPRLSALHNVELPMIYAGVEPHVRRERALLALRIVGMDTRADHAPSQLSGGQQQRVAIARALVNNPDIILADEPTGSLDPANVDEVMRLLTQLNQKGKTIILVTHDMQVANFARRVIFMRDGAIVSDIKR